MQKEKLIKIYKIIFGFLILMLFFLYLEENIHTKIWKYYGCDEIEQHMMYVECKDIQEYPNEMWLAHSINDIAFGIIWSLTTILIFYMIVMENKK